MHVLSSLISVEWKHIGLFPMPPNTPLAHRDTLLKPIPTVSNCSELLGLDHPAVIRAYYKCIIHTDKASSGVPHLDDLDIHAGFQPEIDTDFPAGGSEAIIQHNIHQVWLSSVEVSSVPVQFLDNVKSFLKHNPGWTYYFWTNKTIRALLADRHPHLVSFYDSLPEIVMKGDMVRYIVLYEFGGLYADMDVLSVRSLDGATTKYPCILVTPPFEHSVLWLGKPFVITNCIMLSRAKHPLLKQVLDSIPSRKDEKRVVYKLGPGFLTHQYLKYINNTDVNRVDTDQDTSSPYFYKGPIPVTHMDGVYIPNTRFFTDNPSPQLKGNAKNACNRTDPSNLVRRMCNIIQTRGYERPPGKYTFLDHQWKHTWSGSKKNNKYEFVSIRNMTNNLFIYTPSAPVS